MDNRKSVMYNDGKNADDSKLDEKVREVQQKLNEKGYTDKFGEN